MRLGCTSLRTRWYERRTREGVDGLEGTTLRVLEQRCREPEAFAATD